MIQYDPKNWTSIVLRIHGSVLPRMFWRALMFAAFGAVVAYAHFGFGVAMAIPGTAHAMVGVALGLLLVFRTNASYDRYWEGRKLLGGLTNNFRDLARQVASLIGESPTVRDDSRRYMIALFAAIRRYLRREHEFSELAGVLGEDERAALIQSPTPPLLIARWLSDRFAQETRAGRLSEYRLCLLDATLSDIVDLWGGAERIMKTPVPFAYAHHIKSFLTIFCATTPFALLDSMGWFTPLATAIIVYGLFGIDEIGVEIEDPFGYDPNDLPLDTIGEGISAAVTDVLRAADPGKKRVVSSEPTM